MLLLGLLVALAGCDVEWGGARVALENPAPAPEPETVAPVPEGAPPPAPLPEGPLLWAVRLDGATGAALAVPLARLGPGGLAALELPEPVTERYRARLDSLFAPEGRELALTGGGARLGSLVLDGSSVAPRPDCPSVVKGRALLVPGGAPPALAFATAEDNAPSEPVAATDPEADVRIRTFGPILAEQLLTAAGESRPYLAQRADLQATPWPGDPRPAMAATYLINDAVDGPAPGPAVSLFFLARFDPARGYVPVWSAVHSYDATGGKQVLVYEGAAAGPRGRVDVVSVHDGTATVRLGASAAGGEERRLDWVESPVCPALELLEAAATGAAPGPETPQARRAPQPQGTEAGPEAADGAPAGNVGAPAQGSGGEETAQDGGEAEDAGTG